MIPLKTPAELAKMAKACQITADILAEVGKMVSPGISSLELNRQAEQLCSDAGVKPAFKGYMGFPFALCCSLNQQVVHGFATEQPLEEGDILSLDFGVQVDGYFGDTAVTYAVGAVSDETRRLMDVTKASLMAGIEILKPGIRLGDVSATIQQTAEAAGFSVVRQFVGHGIGRNLHEEPSIPNFGVKGRGVKLKAGMVLAIEPMINAGGPEVKILSDGWTAVTMDGKLSAHFEHTVAVTPDGYKILTLPYAS